MKESLVGIITLLSVSCAHVEQTERTTHSTPEQREIHSGVTLTDSCSHSPYRQITSGRIPTRPRFRREGFPNTLLIVYGRQDDDPVLPGERLVELRYVDEQDVAFRGPYLYVKYAPRPNPRAPTHIDMMILYDHRLDCLNGNEDVSYGRVAAPQERALIQALNLEDY